MRPHRCPNGHFYSRDEVKDRGALVRVETGRRQHAVRVKLCLSGVQRPGIVVDFSAHNATAPHDVQAVALGEPVLERPRLRKELSPDRAVLHVQPGGGCSSMDPLALVMNVLIARSRILRVGRHPRVEIRQSEPETRHTDRHAAPCIETEEVHTRAASRSHVRADIELKKAIRARERRQAAQTDAVHSERNKAHVRSSFKQVQVQLWRKQFAQRARGQCPVCEEQIIPSLLHHVRCPWLGIGAMANIVQNGSEVHLGTVTAGAVAKTEKTGRAP